MDTRAKDVELVDIELELAQLAYALHFSLNRYRSFSHAVVGMLCSPSHHGLLICKIYSIN